MRAALIGLLLAFSSLCGAAEERRYAVFSIIGDRFLIAGPRTSVGKPASLGSYIVLDDPVIDAGALLAVKVAVDRVDPAASTVLLLSRDPALFAAQDKVLEQSGDARALIDAIRPLIGNVKGSHLILVSKLRHEPRMRFADSYFDSSGRLEGVGFYIDSAKRVARVDTGQVAYGYLGIFAYFRITVIDLASWQILREEEVVASTTHREPGKDPWDGMPAEDKVRVVKALVAGEIARAMPRILAPS